MSSYNFNCKVEDNIENESAKLWNKLLYKVKGGGGVKIGRHKIGAWNEMGQNRIKGGWGVQKPHKMWDIIYARSLIEMSFWGEITLLKEKKKKKKKKKKNYRKNVFIEGGGGGGRQNRTS